MSGTTILVLFAIVNVVVTGLFAGMVTRQYARRHRVYQLYWTIGLLMAFFATLSYILMILAQPTSSAGIAFFRLYYILGAALTPAWLGLGSIALVTSPRVSRISMIVLSILSILAAVLIAIAGINEPALSKVAGTPGTGVLLPGAWLVTIIVLNSLGVLAVVGVALYSGWKLMRRQASVAGFHPGNLLWANVLIFVGDILNALAGTAARAFGLNSSFWLIMALGWIVFFSGVLLTSRRSVTSRSSTESHRPDAPRNVPA